MTKTKAIQTARNRVGEIYKFGDNYRFNHWDESVNAWRESNPSNYFSAQFARSQYLICEAMELMGFRQNECYSAMAQYCNGNWVDHLNNMIEKYQTDV